MQTLAVPGGETKTKIKKTRPKSPRRKAPTLPKNKDSDDKSVKSKKKSSSNGTKAASSDNEKSEKSLRRSVSPRKEQYSSLLDEMVGRGDMVLLDSITEEGILENLKKRYKEGEIYVSSYLN